MLGHLYCCLHPNNKYLSSFLNTTAQRSECFNRSLPIVSLSTRRVASSSRSFSRVVVGRGPDSLIEAVTMTKGSQSQSSCPDAESLSHASIRVREIAIALIQYASRDRASRIAP